MNRRRAAIRRALPAAGLFLLVATAWAQQAAAPAGPPRQDPAPAADVSLPVAADPGTMPEVVTDDMLEQASGGRTVRIGSLSGGPVTVWPLEAYVARVLAGEAAPNTPDGALQALAVAARTFTIANEGRHAREGYDICDTTHCQVYRAANAASRRATLASAGRILTYQGAPAEVFYSASCGGHTERAADVWARGARFPYLTGVADDVHGADPLWQLDRSLDEVQEAVGRAGHRGRRLRDVRVGARSASGRVTRVLLPGLVPESMTGDQFRGALGFGDLRSTNFQLVREGDRLHFEGRGYGHGVGLCVIGAGRRAGRGESADAILRHYFPALEVRALGAIDETVAAR